MTTTELTSKQIAKLSKEYSAWLRSIDERFERGEISAEEARRSESEARHTLRVTEWETEAA